MLKNIPVFEQSPGCLPHGYDLDSMLTPEQFCVWAQIKRDWFTANLKRIAGVKIYSRKTIRIHPRTYIEGKK
jgi:hypothetical protein